MSSRRGAGSVSERAHDPAKVTKSVPASREKSRDKTALQALETFLEENPPSGIGLVEAAMGRKLAAALDTAPDYAISRLANTLIVVLDRLGREDELIEQAQAGLEWL